MKKLVFMLIAVLSVALTGCSALDSEPIEPTIIGTGNLQYEAKSGTWFVVVDSTQYTVTDVTAPDPNAPAHNAKKKNIEPVDGMLVTVFTSSHMKGIQAVTGKQSVEQIEELYHTNETCLVLFFCFFVLGLIFLWRTSKMPIVNNSLT